MTTTTETQGFFTTSGILRNPNEVATAPATAPQETAQIATDVADEAAAATVKAITDAAVVSISQRLNVGGTGFDRGVSEMVSEAVGLALRNKQSASNATEAVKPLEIGGTFQNEILAGGAKDAPPQTTPAPPLVPSTPGNKGSRGQSGTSRGNRGGRRFTARV